MKQYRNLGLFFLKKLLTETEIEFAKMWLAHFGTVIIAMFCSCCYSLFSILCLFLSSVFRLSPQHKDTSTNMEIATAAIIMRKRHNSMRSFLSTLNQKAFFPGDFTLFHTIRATWRNFLTLPKKCTQDGQGGKRSRFRVLTFC